MAALRELLDTEGVPLQDQLIRRIARQGYAESGVVLTRDDLHPEPTVAVDGVWWHPVGITDPGLKVTDTPLPFRAAIDEMARILDATAQQRDNTRRRSDAHDDARRPRRPLEHRSVARRSVP